MKTPPDIYNYAGFNNIRISCWKILMIYYKRKELTAKNQQFKKRKPTPKINRLNKIKMKNLVRQVVNQSLIRVGRK